MQKNDPIIAIATAAGRAGIGVIRLSGPKLSNFIEQFFGQALTPRYAHYRQFLDADGNPIDSGIALYFKGPNSYTGEDVLELQGHGGAAVLKRVLQRCLEVGQSIKLRHAKPGEFTQRAFLNGRLDLAQAEAVADLIDASSEAAAIGAMASLSGKFSNQINQLNQKIIHLRKLVEATLDFPEEEIDFLEKYQALPQLESIRQQLSAIIKTSQQGVVLREGLQIVLAGQPNVGKSSLLNALAGDDIAIVTPIAGTTRDRVTQEIHIEGVPMHIIDTAGLRETDDVVEKIGIERTWEEINKASLIIHLKDIRHQDDTLGNDINQRLSQKVPILSVLNKADLLDSDKQFVDEIENDVVVISAKTGFGLDTLKQKLLDFAGWNPTTESPWLARQRHLNALYDGDKHLEIAAAHAQLDDSVLDLFAEELRLAHESLSQITGEFTSDDLLGEIFSSFCIGK
ncbi:MAG TPA: tRNA uridine-5-carboxymethylaminomethyl(34) synthesis GTPase MnmE [Burkholderiaceae bacterium]|nr:tRNA uridine-5-carboxymethylaminomethyl(34) synthesis GTPase MnmE [Burkholderiaceae bacterium]